MRDLRDRTLAQSFSDAMVREAREEGVSFKSALESEAELLEKSISGTVTIVENPSDKAGVAFELRVIMSDSAGEEIIKRAMEECFHRIIQSTIYA
jgi:hypothetical protein